MRYHNITKCDVLNGDGVRVVLWLSGCNHHCQNCHNPETWDENGGLLFDENAKQELFDTLDSIYIDGITFSGGDPLFPKNRAEVGELIEQIHQKFPQKTIWLYTGYLWEDIKDLPFIKYIDVLIDGRFEQDKFSPNAKWVGSSNQRIIDVQKTIKDQSVVLYYQNVDEKIEYDQSKRNIKCDC